MKLKIYFLLVTATLAIHGLQAQKEYNNWYFGTKAGLTWNKTRSYNATGKFGTATDVVLTNLPVVTRSEIETSEGCFAISDAEGNMLFYSDGITIWDALHNPMPNANNTHPGDKKLTGHSSSVNSGVIVPYPGEANRGKYIAFTLGQTSANNLSYSIVDMSLRGGLGDVVAGQKNILLTGAMGTLGENVAVVRNSNKTDFWIVATGRGAATYSYLNVWKVDQSGVQTALHSVGSIELYTRNGVSSGNLKFTDKGGRFVWNVREENSMVFGTFDTALGQFTSIKKRSRYRLAGYGAEFSKSAKYLYLTDFNDNNSNFYVFDMEALLSAADPETVDPIKYFTLLQNGSPTENSDHMCSLVIAPDGYLYGVNFRTQHMYVMPNPEDPANLRIYKLVNFLGSGRNDVGLPTFAAPLFSIEIIPPSDICMKTEGDYEIKIYGGYEFEDVESIKIDWGDGQYDVIASPVAGSITYKHTYDKEGMYTVFVTPYKDAAQLVPLDEYIKTADIIVKGCVIPVNPNIHMIESGATPM